MYFSEPFLSILIVIALIGISIAAVSLIVLFIKDMKTKNIW